MEIPTPINLRIRKPQDIFASVLQSIPEGDTRRRELAEAIRHALDRYNQVTLGPTDGEMAADALDGIAPDKKGDPQP